MRIIESSEELRRICEAGHERKADDIVVMEMGKKSSICEFFIVMGGTSSVRVKAIVDHIEDSLEKDGRRALHKEGYQEASWVLLDYGDIIVHVFYGETRKFYDLENLWGDVRKETYLP